MMDNDNFEHLADLIKEGLKKSALQEKYYKGGDFSTLEFTNQTIDSVFDAKASRRSYKKKKDIDSESNKFPNGQSADKEYPINADDLDDLSQVDIQTLKDAKEDGYGFVRPINEQILLGAKNKSSKYYSDNAPLKLLCESDMKTIIKTALFVLLHPKAKSETIDLFFQMSGLPKDASSEEILKGARKLLLLGLSMILTKQNAAGISATQEQNSTSEDFNKIIPDNKPYIDHLRKWNHSRAATKVVFAEEPLDEIEQLSTQSLSDSIKTVDEKIDFESLLSNLSEDNQMLLRMLLQGYSEKEIAKYYGISPQAISKRKAILKKEIEHWIDKQ